MKSARTPISASVALVLLLQVVLVHAVVPTTASALTRAEARGHSGRIAAGDEHSLAVRPGGVVEAWGADSLQESSVPAGLNDVVSVAAGSAHSLALRSDETVVAWGANDYGQSSVPPDLTGVIALAAGWEHSLALRSDGTVVAWGGNGYGQSSVPAGLSGVVMIAAGGSHSLALKSDGTVVAWGSNGSGQTKVPTAATGVEAIAAGGHHSLALKSDGTVVGWGRNDERQVQIPPDLSGVAAIAAGLRHSMALKTDGSVVAWGGLRILDGSYDPSTNVPSGLSGVVAIGAGGLHSLALTADGTSVGWGVNASGQAFGIVSADPASGEVVAPEDGAFTVTYSAPAQAGANYAGITLKDRDGNIVAVDKALTGRVLTVEPTAPLTTDNRYTLSIPAGAIRDAYGMTSAGSFFTVWTPDTIPPVVVAVRPVAGAGDVSVRTRVTVEFSESISEGPGIGSTTLTSGGGSTVDCMYSTLLGLLVITPHQMLDPETSYTLFLPAGAVTDLTGNPLEASLTSSFTTGATHTITATASEGGTISPSGPYVVDHGGTKAFTVTPQAGYKVDEVRVDGGLVELTGGGYTFEGVTSDHTIAALFVRTSHTLSYGAGEGGTLSGDVSQTVDRGASGSPVSAVPGTGYVFAQWSDGRTDNPRTDSNVTADIDVDAIFAAKTYTLTYSAGTGGSISGTTPQSVAHGSSGTAVTAVPDPGYVFVRWSDEQGTAIRTDSDVTADITVQAEFATSTHTITASAGTGGTITPSGAVAVGDGSDRTFTITADPGYEVATVLVDDAPVTLTQNTYTFTDVTRDYSIAVTFTLKAVDPDPDPLPPIIKGDNRFATAIAGSKAAYPDGAPAVVIATGENFADALGGAGLAGALDSPLLLTQKASLSGPVMTEVGRLKARKAYILGGTGAVSAQVESALKTRLGTDNVIRLQGANRYQTADRVAAETIRVLNASGTYSGDAFIATGANFPDALGASPVAASQGMPVFLSDPARTTVPLPASVRRVWITGGTAVVSSQKEAALKTSLGNANVRRLAGANRFETAAKVAVFGVSRGMQWEGVGITTGMNFPDALAAGPVLGSRDAVMLLTDTDAVPQHTRTALTANKDRISRVTFFGGDAAVPLSVRRDVESYAGVRR